MKKKAFTLQEVLVTLGIIGVVAAMTIPAMMKMKPYETKMKYMKAYNSLANLADEIASDDILYPTVRNDAGNITSGALLNWTLPGSGDSLINSIDPIYFQDGFYTRAQGVIASGPSGPGKFGYLLSRRMTLSGNYQGANNISRFTTIDGINWVTMGTNSNAAAGIPANYTTNYQGVSDPTTDIGRRYRNVVQIDINGADGPNCSYSANCNQDPDQFVFYVNNSGNVEPADALGRAFLQDPTKINDKAADLQRARNL